LFLFFVFIVAQIASDPIRELVASYFNPSSVIWASPMTNSPTKPTESGVVDSFSWVDVSYFFTSCRLKNGKKCYVEQAAVRSSSGLVKKGELIAVMGECSTF